MGVAGKGRGKRARGNHRDVLTQIDENTTRNDNNNNNTSTNSSSSSKRHRHDQEHPSSSSSSSSRGHIEDDEGPYNPTNQPYLDRN